MKNISIIGAGTMGRGIALSCLEAGYVTSKYGIFTETLGEKYRPCPILRKYVKAGWLGKKSGRGFYQYD